MLTPIFYNIEQYLIATFLKQIFIVWFETYERSCLLRSYTRRPKNRSQSQQLMTSINLTWHEPVSPCLKALTLQNQVTKCISYLVIFTWFWEWLEIHNFFLYHCWCIFTNVEIGTDLHLFVEVYNSFFIQYFDIYLFKGTNSIHHFSKVKFYDLKSNKLWWRFLAAKGI